MKRLGATRHPKHLVFFENGEFYDDWTKAQSGGSGWRSAVLADYQGEALDWVNASATTYGLASHWMPYASGRYGTHTGEDDHMVHVRIPISNEPDEGGFAIGPATAIHTTGNGYGCVSYTVASVRYVAIVKVAAWGIGGGLGSVIQSVERNDVLSMSYSYATGTATATLIAYVNGTAVLTVTDSSGAYRMSTVSGRPGLYGHNFPSIPDASTVGHWTPEWWVTQGAYYEEPPSKSQRTGSIRINIYKPQRYTDDAAPTIRHVLSGDMITGRWTHKRIGGSATLSCSVRFQDVLDSGVASEHIEAKAFDDPTFADWSNSQWLGGQVTVEYHHKDDRLTVPTVLEGTNVVWRGLLSRLDYNPNTKIIQLHGEGLVKAMDYVQVTGEYVDTPIKDIIKDLIQNNSKSPKTAKGGFGDHLFNYDPTKIVGDQGALSLRITIDFQFESLSSALRKLFVYLPPGASWGIDVTGDFYLDQQVPHYTEDLSTSGIQHFTVDNDVVQFDKQLDFSAIRTALLVQGKEKEGAEKQPLGESRVQGWGYCERMREMFGLRTAVQTDDSITDEGFATKVAAAQLKKIMLPALSATLDVYQPITENKEMFQSLTRAAPMVSVDDRLGNEQPVFDTDQGASANRIVTEYLLRRFGEDTAYRAHDLGSNGGAGNLASTALEQNLNKSWLIRCVLTFDEAHPGSNGQYAYILGRPEDGLSGERGWGGLWWYRNSGDPTNDGKLFWERTDNLGGTRQFSSGITIDPDTPASTVVHLTIYRNAAGDMKFYNGNTETGTSNLGASETLQVTTFPWRFWDHNRTIANYLDGDFSIEEFAVYDTQLMEAMVPTGANGVVDFIAANNDKRLQRQWSQGLLLYAPFSEKGSSAVSLVSVKAWQNIANVATGVNLNWQPGGSASGTKTTSVTGAVRGQQVGAEKKWGGPLIMQADRVAYSVDTMTGILHRRFQLGTPPENAFTVLAAVKDQIRRLEESNRRNERESF